MIDISHKKCYICKITIAIFGLPDSKNLTHCGKCKTDNMIDI